ncbi:unnamed protein product [Dicrocoelium dendriticum]|nr:unnamed protein product [Dicrocoelium dendriticum]
METLNVPFRNTSKSRYSVLHSALSFCPISSSCPLYHAAVSLPFSLLFRILHSYPMPLRLSRTVARFLIEKIRDRLKLLESLLLELHDVDNRLKMELLSLTSLADADLVDSDLDEDDEFPIPFNLINEAANHVDAPHDFSPYHLIDLDQVWEPEERERIYSDIMAADADNLDGFVTLEGHPNVGTEEDGDDDDGDVDAKQGDAALQLPGSTSQAVNFLSGLLNDSSLNFSYLTVEEGTMSSAPSAGLTTESLLNTDRLLRFRHPEEQSSAADSVGSSSPSSSLSTPSPFTLRSRRALNTTPDSSSSLLSTQNRLCSPSPILDSNQSADASHLRRHSPESSHTIRQQNHVYFRDEPCEDFTESDDIGPVEDTFLSDQVPQNKVVLSTWIYCAALSILILLIVLWSRLHAPDYTPPSHSTISDRLHTLMGQLSAEFPNQTSRFWAQLRSALEQPYRRVWSNNGHLDDDLSNPTVVLFVKRQPWNDGNNGNIDFNSLFRCFINRFASLTTSAVLGRDRPDCVVPIQPNMLGIREEQPLIDKESANYKLDIDTKLKRAYNNGIRCFHFPSIDALPPDVMLLFHGIADAQNSVYKEALLLFSLGHTFRFDNQSVPFDSALASEHRQLERQIQRHLRTLWTSALGSEETDALLSRLTPTIAVFHPTESVVPATCEGNDA